MRRFYPYVFVADLLTTIRALDPNRHPPPSSLPARYRDIFTHTYVFLTRKYPIPIAANSAILFEVKELEIWFRFMKASLIVLKNHFEDHFDDLHDKHRDVIEDNLASASLMDYSREPEPLAPPAVLPTSATVRHTTGNTLEGCDAGLSLNIDLTNFDFTAMHHVYEIIIHTLKNRESRYIASRFHSIEWIVGIDTAQYNYPIYLLWVASRPEDSDGMSFYNFQLVSEYIRADVLRAIVTTPRVKEFMNQQKECMTRSIGRKTWNVERLKNSERLRVIVQRGP